MEDSESVQSYCLRVITIVNQVKGLGHKPSEAEVVSKVLRSLAPKFDYVAVALKESRDLLKLTLDELSCSLQAHEITVNRSSEKVSEKALHVKGESSALNVKEKGNSNGHAAWNSTRGRERSFSRGRGMSRGGNRSSESRSNIQCFNCKKFSHYKAECWGRGKPQEKGGILVAEEKEKPSNMFMASCDSRGESSSVWLIDSGCSRHMTCEKQFFCQLDNSKTESVHLGHDKEMRVEGIGTVNVASRDGSMKQPYGVQYVLGLAYNLLNVGQLLSRGYVVLFEGDSCIIRDERTKKQVIVMARTQNNMFPVDISKIGRVNVAVDYQEMTNLWHMHYGHLNFRSLRQLEERKMVHGLSTLKGAT